MGGRRSQRLEALTHTRITWVLSPMGPQVPGVTLGSPLCPWCCGHFSRRGARYVAAILKAPAASNGHNFVVQAPNLLSNYSIGIYSLRRCRWTPHLLHSGKYSLSYVPPKLWDSEVLLLGCHSWAVMSLTTALTELGTILRQHSTQNPLTSCPHLRLRYS